MPKKTKQSPLVDKVRAWADQRFAELATPEHKFHPARRWAFDLAWPERRVAFEFEGGTWTGGRHTSGAGYQSDAEKYSVAAALGWAVIRATASQVRSGQLYEWLEYAYRNRNFYPDPWVAEVCHSLSTTNILDSQTPLPGSMTPRQRRLKGGK